MDIFPTTILLATDGSEEANLAIRTATELSKRTDSEVHVIYVLPTPRQLIGHHLYTDAARDALIGEAERDAETFLKKQAEKISSDGGKVADTHLRVGPPDKEILRAAEALGVGMIIMGSRGLGAISRTLVGSVSESVVQHAHCPVLVVRK